MTPGSRARLWPFCAPPLSPSPTIAAFAVLPKAPPSASSSVRALWRAWRLKTRCACAQRVNQQGMTVDARLAGRKRHRRDCGAPVRRGLSQAAGRDCRAQAERQHQREADADGAGAFPSACRNHCRGPDQARGLAGQLCAHRHGGLAADAGHARHRPAHSLQARACAGPSAS